MIFVVENSLQEHQQLKRVQMNYILLINFFLVPKLEAFVTGLLNSEQPRTRVTKLDILFYR